MKYKTCSCCGQDKPIWEFGKDAKNPDGLKYQCKQCIKAKRPRRAVPHLSDEQFSRMYGHPPFQHHINKMAKRYGFRRLEFREDLRQRGWVGAWQASSTDEYVVKKNIEKEIYLLYQQERRFLKKDALGYASSWGDIDDATQNDNV